MLATSNVNKHFAQDPYSGSSCACYYAKLVQHVYVYEKDMPWTAPIPYFHLYIVPAIYI